MQRDRDGIVSSERSQPVQGHPVSEVGTTSGVVAPPEPTLWEPDESWEHFDVFEAVKKALTALPYSFATDLVITGVAATDLFSFNTSLGASIENQVVKALNEIRPLWDPNQRYVLYRFVRQSQRFPDVILRASDPALEPSIIMGIELKGWYALAKSPMCLQAIAVRTLAASLVRI